MKLSVLIILLLLACMYPSLAQGSYENCCLQYNKMPKKHIRQKIVSYRMQETDGGCNIPAVVFTLAWKKIKSLCANPQKPWVQQLMKKLGREFMLN